MGTGDRSLGTSRCLLLFAHPPRGFKISAIKEKAPPKRGYDA